MAGSSNSDALPEASTQLALKKKRKKEKAIKNLMFASFQEHKSSPFRIKKCQAGKNSHGWLDFISDRLIIDSEHQTIQSF